MEAYAGSLAHEQVGGSAFRPIGSLSATGQYVPPMVLSKVEPRVLKVEEGPLGMLSPTGIYVPPLEVEPQAVVAQGRKKEAEEAQHTEGLEMATH
mmetsp:Transcript_39484/g.61565  ORF Transcript_39484/g.61565 Transcript_39484/m.61565 type:complete len:95 (-) Transcript_39484:1286-1570(-)